MSKRVLSPLPFVEARRVGGKQKPTSIRISLSSTTSDKGAALGIANYQHRHDAPLKSYHYVVDAGGAYQCIPDNIAAYGNPYRAISVQICAEPREYIHTWENGTDWLAVRRAAKLVAELMRRHKIRPRNLDEDQERLWFNHRWRRNGGLITRVEGMWPYDVFLNDICADLARKDKS